MSKKKNRLGSSEEILSNIGNRISGQKSKNKEDEEENASTNNNEEEINDQDQAKENSKSEEDNEEKNEDVNDSWFEEQEPYRSSFIVKPKMEDDFENCKRKFRKELRMNLSKQNAIELGWLLLKNLDETYFNEVKKISSPDDDLVESLKEIIKKLS
jgi:hypothetical protein